MSNLPHPAELLLVTLAGFLNRRQGLILDYLLEENRVLREQLRGRRLRLTIDQRRRLASKGQRLGRRVLARIATIVTPDTILRWHRQRIAAKWTFGNPRVGRPGVRAEIRELVLRLARDNATWGYCRIQGALANLGHRVAPTTIRKLLREHGVRPSPERPTSWRTFLRAHWQAIAATDFFTAEVWTRRACGPTTCCSCWSSSAAACTSQGSRGTPTICSWPPWPSVRSRSRAGSGS
ncbi:MAG TPA: hypothetical protein VJP77_09595 [Planctomycetota bacterium]|nr:hypothetical protein [Planctomycetota bacterium]